MNIKTPSNFLISCFLIIISLSSSSRLFGETYYLDPVNGDNGNSGTLTDPWGSMSDVIDDDMIMTQAYSPLPYSASSVLIGKNVDGQVEAGDTLVLRDGMHGTIFLQNYINASDITVMGYDGEEAILESIHLRACKHWVFDNIVVSSEPYGTYLNGRLFYIESHGWQGPSSHITVQNCQIYSTEAPWSTAQEWLDNVSSGLYIRGDSCTAMYNHISNVDMGLTCYGDYITAEHNEIINFSGDGGRVLGSHIAFNYNTIKNCYDVDDNHDDGIQSFTTNGIVVDNNEVIGNLIINNEDPNQPLAGPLQGLAMFDGFYNDWLIANNVISVNHWHGISVYGARRCTLIHNTVIDPTPDITPGGSWIRIDDTKDGEPSVDCLVANNVANQFVVLDGDEVSNVVLDTYAEYDDNFVEYDTFDFRLITTSELIDSADNQYSLSVDYVNTFRGNSPDIGAYEYLKNIGLGETCIELLPDPDGELYTLHGVSSTYDLAIIYPDGTVYSNLDNTTEEIIIDTSTLPEGTFLIRVSDPSNVQMCLERIIKE